MKINNAFLSLSAASGAVPGLAVLATGIGTPPESKALFGGVMESLGAFSLLLLWVNREKIRAMSAVMISRRATLFILLFSLSLLLYVVLFNLCVSNVDGETYFPLWISGELKEMVRLAGGRDAALTKYGIDAVHEAIHNTSDIALSATTAVLLLTYEACFTFLTVAFALLAIREKADLLQK
jgi:hypothetical protein